MVIFPWVTDREESLATLEQQGALFTHISPVWLKVRADGSIVESANPRVNEAARRFGLKLVPLVANEGFTPESAEAILTDAATRNRVADELAQRVLERGWDGINLDFEGPWGYRSEYTAFVQRICAHLQPHGKEVSVDVTAQTAPPKGCGRDASWADPFDYPALGAIVDRLIIMGYDFHGVTTVPGPVGPAWWLERVLHHTLRCVPKERVVVGLPLYGYRWIQTDADQWKGEYVSYAFAEELRRQYQAPLQWDYDALSRHFSFVDAEGRLNVVHYDDAASVGRRLERVAAHGVAGVAFWCLGLGDPGVWTEVARLKAAHANGGRP